MKYNTMILCERSRPYVLVLSCLVLLSNAGLSLAADELRVLFLGDQGHHRPSQLAETLIPVMQSRGIQVEYTEDLDVLTVEKLQDYDCLLLYANIDVLPASGEQALLNYVAEGGGFFPLHCASYCFRNSAAFIDLVGAQFQRHGGEVFATKITQPEHPIMQGFGGFRSWDETYIHTRHNDRNRIVLEVRETGDQAAGREAEPWTWVRTHGEGRVFYTAWGHDERTWEHAGFQNLVERGIRWVSGDDPTRAGPYQDQNLFPIPEMTAPRTDVAEFEYKDVGPKIPNYVPSRRWGTQGEAQTLMQQPLSPEESLKHYVTPKDFRLELFAAEPELGGKPIAMNWDHRGRLWVCETIDYPNELMPPEEGRDRIRICEDTDGDGKADKFTIFAENLSIPTSLEFYRGGVVVQAGVQTLFLRDNDGDDVSDQREVLITGWEMGDTHGGVSNFQYGLDNRYWAMQGYNDSHPEYAGGRHRGFRQGPFNFSVAETEQPQVTEVEFIRSTTNNSWGLGSSEEGLIFASTANRAPSFFVPIPNRYYERVRGWTPSLMADLISDDHLFDPITDKVRQVDHHGGFTAGAGHALYTARNYPQAWWNRVAFVCGPTGHLVATFVLNRDGATFEDTNAFNLIASDDEWAAPIQAEVGPDGNVWILDWYNYIVQHNPTPQGFKTGKGNAYESDLRDKTHGRIYRLVYEGEDGRPFTPAPELDPEDPKTLVAALSHSNRLWRRHAQRLLVERGQGDVTESLVKLVEDQQVDPTGNNAGATHALWTLKGIGQLETAGGPAFEAATAALAHPAAGVRRNAALVLPGVSASVQAIVQAGILRDADPQVQLGALMALADAAANETAGEALAELAVDQELMADRYLREAVICAAAAHADSFLAGMVASGQPAARPGDDNGADLAESQVQATQVIAEHLARRGIRPEKLEQLLVRLSAGRVEVAQAVIDGLAAGWPEDASVQLSPESENALQQLIDRLPADRRGPLVRLATAWGSERLQAYADEIAAGLLSSVEDASLAAEARVSAAREFVNLVGTDEDAMADLIATLTPQMPPAVASGIVRSLTGATAESVIEELLYTWPSMTPALREDAVAVMLARPSTTERLLGAIEDGKISVSDLTLDQRQRLNSHPNEQIQKTAVKLLAATGGMASADRQKVIDAYAEAVHGSGSVANGKQVFVKNCASCHKHSGEGKEIGPDLTGMAVHPKEELIVHILDPNRSVEGNFRRYTLLTTGGQILTGMLAAESLSAVELIDAEGKRQAIAREDIERIKSTNQSLMPEGFEQQIDVEGMADLLEFLTNKGQYVPLPLASVATAISTKGLFSRGDDGPDRLVFDDWSGKVFQGVPFQLVDPQGKQKPNIILLNGPNGTLPPSMPKKVTVTCNMRLKSLHMLGGVSGWGFPYSRQKTTSMVVRFNYADGSSEEHPLVNGLHIADYIRRVDVPESQFAYRVGGQQVRYLSIEPKLDQPIETIDLVKGDDISAPMVVALTAEQFQKTGRSE